MRRERIVAGCLLAAQRRGKGEQGSTGLKFISGRGSLSIKMILEREFVAEGVTWHLWRSIAKRAQGTKASRGESYRKYRHLEPHEQDQSDKTQEQCFLLSLR